MTQDEQDKITWLTTGLDVLAVTPGKGAARELLLRVLGAGRLMWLDAKPATAEGTFDIPHPGGVLRLTDLRPGSNLEIASTEFVEALGPLAAKALFLS